MALKVVQIANGRFVALGPMLTPGQQETLRKLKTCIAERPVSPTEGDLQFRESQDRCSALCGAPHKADYVDASIMWSFQRGSSEKLVSMGIAGS